VLSSHSSQIGATFPFLDSSTVLSPPCFQIQWRLKSFDLVCPFWLYSIAFIEGTILKFTFPTTFGFIVHPIKKLGQKVADTCEALALDAIHRLSLINIPCRCLSLRGPFYRQLWTKSSQLHMYLERLQTHLTGKVEQSRIAKSESVDYTRNWEQSRVLVPIHSRLESFSSLRMSAPSLIRLIYEQSSSSCASYLRVSISTRSCPDHAAQHQGSCSDRQTSQNLRTAADLQISRFLSGRILRSLPVFPHLQISGTPENLAIQV